MSKLRNDLYQRMNGFKPVKNHKNEWYYKDYDNLKRYLPEIDNAPQAAQDVALDIQYNPGITSTTWTNFKNYFNNKNINELAKQVHRIGISENRNNEMRDKILSIKKW